MPFLRVPSLQHLARNWRPNEASIARLLVQVALNPPFFNYAPLYGVVRDLLVLKVPYSQVLAGILTIKRAAVRNNLAEVVPLIRDHFEDLNPTYLQSVDRRYYPVGRNLMVPFDAPLLYGVGGQLHFPWFSFWRQNPLQGEALSLFVSLVDEILAQDPDLEGSIFDILDFSCVGKSQRRSLTVINASDIPRLSFERKTEMLETFAGGYVLALSELRKKAPTSKNNDATMEQTEDLQADLFK